MQKQIKDLPLSLQSLFVEIKAEQDAINASKLDYVSHPVNKNKLDDYEQLDIIHESENQDDEYDEYDENTYDMNCVSPSMREMFE
tara:strand:+ start:231 stop:485 length:255 start_codon:yes stop_codon:yes gene_type:complete